MVFCFQLALPRESMVSRAPDLYIIQEQSENYKII